MYADFFPLYICSYDWQSFVYFETFRLQKMHVVSWFEVNEHFKILVKFNVRYFSWKKKKKNSQSIKLFFNLVEEHV